MARWWNASRAKLPARWADVRGPLGAMHLTLQRLGWSAEGPFQVRTVAGYVVNLITTPPALLKDFVQRDADASW